MVKLMNTKTNYGHYNEIPENFRPISPDKFASIMMFYPDIHTEYRQLIGLKDIPYATSAKLWFFHDGTGIALTEECIKNDKDFPMYKYVAGFYAFGCDHEYEPIAWDSETMGPQYRCTHASKCKKCGRVWIVDSSD